MSTCPLVELLITYRYGIPVYSWVNKEKQDLASAIGESIESTNLISGLLSAILSFSESMTSDNTVKQIKMDRITYQYSVADTLIFFIGYDAKASAEYERIIDEYLFEVIDHFQKLYEYQIGDDVRLASQDFTEFAKFLDFNIESQRWKIERTEDQILTEIKELLMDILGPMSADIFSANLRELKYLAKGGKVDLDQLSSNLVYEISLLMDPTQANQIGEEITNIIMA
ncbi:MAG: hypothetical protein INQ03_05935 [Candidatus Heimdallarchaeota archaeon]|nr:hypothetical protein [Candidatus Heimdallarchaeota archaeon]